MFLVNGKTATLKQYNRNEVDIYDDQDITSIQIKLCPYNEDITVKFGRDTINEAKGYFIVKNIDVKVGDQIIYNGNTFTILEVRDNWIFNKIESISVAVK